MVNLDSDDDDSEFSDWLIYFLNIRWFIIIIIFH